MIPCCPNCHRPLLRLQLGVDMPPIKTRIVEAIKLAGDIGISSLEIITELKRDDGKDRKLDGIKAHIWQLRDWYLADTKWTIEAEGRGPQARWFLRRKGGKHGKRQSGEIPHAGREAGVHGDQGHPPDRPAVAAREL